MIYNLNCLQYNDIVGGEWCYCRNKDSGVGWDYMENILNGYSCKFLCCYVNNEKNVYKYWSTSISGWIDCAIDFENVMKNIQKTNKIKSMKLDSSKKDD